MRPPFILIRHEDFEGGVHWLYGERLAGILTARRCSEVSPALAEVDRAMQRGFSAVGFVAYEAAHGFDRAFPEAQAGLPLAWFALVDLVPLSSHDKGAALRFSSVACVSDFPDLTPLSPLFVNGEGGMPALHTPDSPSPFTERGLGGEARASSERGLGGEVQRSLHSAAWSPTLTESDYRRALQRIRAYIEAGDVYQVNYSFRLCAPFAGDTLALFWRLYHAQPVPYAAYIDTGEHVILSLSPELFFMLEGEQIVSRPMKGTAPRGLTLEDDLQQAQVLHYSEKNRAENLMIVDMVRNDLGRIAKTGSVRVPKLFETERYATLWQMTSTVEAQTNAPLSEIFRALFPAASITGAPKIRATEIIHELETAPRGIYTGAVGVVLPNRRAQFNVAIRTMHYLRATGQLEYGVGSGVVWDSEAQDEYQECLTKAQAILRPRPEFELLETMLWRAGRGYFLLEKHLQRLQRSAEHFGFKVEMEAVRELLRSSVPNLTSVNRLSSHACDTPDFSPSTPAPLPRGGRGEPSAAPYGYPPSPTAWERGSGGEGYKSVVLRCRLLVNRYGEARLECAPLEQKPRIWRVALALEPVDPSDVFLYHKTTHRQVYERARAACPDCDDVILWNPRGEITESTIANVVVKLRGRRYTPPVACGLLGGVYREHLLERGWIEERVITLEELHQAEAIYLINSVRGWVRAVLTRPRTTP